MPVAAKPAPNANPNDLLQRLIARQRELGWLAPETLEELAQQTGLPVHRVRSTASFYSFLNTTQALDHVIRFSDNITDRMLGSDALIERLCSRLLIEAGHPSEDGRVLVTRTSCTGLCDQGPALLVNGHAMPRLDARRIDELSELIRERVAVSDWPTDWFRIDDNIHRRDRLLDHRLRGGEALGAALAQPPEQLLAAIRASGLRGRGGAGFDTGTKWSACRQADGLRVVVCNADEGEPGTFKDRVLLATEPDLVIDGMCAAAHAIGANQGFIYLRGEYAFLEGRLRALLEQRRREASLGANILGSSLSFDIELHLGAGAYICGEESALIESLEGKPGKPRIRPPFPVTHGYLGRPTIVNNVETFACAALIATRGAQWFRQAGTAQSPGTKLLSVSGDVAQPGIYEFPYGTRLSDVLQACGADRPQAATIAGAAGPCLSADQFDRRLGFEDLATSGSIMVFGPERDMFEFARQLTVFFEHESCGFCTPCRVGTAVNARLIAKLERGFGSPYDLDEIGRMHSVMQGASHCGLGNTASVALTDLLTRFRPAFERRLHTTQFEPAFDLDAALAPARSITRRDDPGAHLSNDPGASDPTPDLRSPRTMPASGPQS